ncbi:PREDICTED: uncharacterized protein LOC106744320 [Dinoponera quadriceps]|uniref:Uncharacterized protein LOC106744320 n=1 Tax=Dinoponera quadriceps TaxID=609295 RepID=A0A6P3X859_DINQU|nr:PREDICTED: uncharacterized protein LOC106744320 [Dinoponera quadriceps]XP_014474477.1 PREDICTED: uncharacterized protein LOC106744320 [Dinoponera quadriceps]XP_014474478.1 PREDICTED: uncharacterized protein LOC106744320 [Dinoponera quadriceps]
MADVDKTIKNISTDTHSNLENCSKEEYLKKLHAVINDIKFPDDFDTWTAEEQCDWKCQVIKEIVPNVPKSLQSMISANFYPIEFHRNQKKLPEWMDIDKFRRAQKFVSDHYFSIVLNHLLSILRSLTFNDGLKAFILGENVHTPYLAFRRYLSTMKRMLAWYEGDPWVKGTKAYREIQITHGKHIAISKKLASMNHEAIDNLKIENPWCPERELLLKDFAATCPFEKLDERLHELIKYFPFRSKSINNADMAVIQGTFMIAPILYPQNIGLHGITDEDLDAFCHMWRCYGYFLGIEDKYNFCHGSFEEIKQRTWDLTHSWLIPNFKNIEANSLHVIRCAIESINYFPLPYIPAKTLILLLLEALNLNMPNLYASLSYGEWIAYKIYTFILRHIMKFSIMRTFTKQLLVKVFEAASNFGPEMLTELQQKSKQQVPDSFVHF